MQFSPLFFFFFPPCFNKLDPSCSPPCESQGRDVCSAPPRGSGRTSPPPLLPSPALPDSLPPARVHAQLSPSSAAMQNNHHKEHLYKILVIGDLGVGKTSIIKRYVHHNFSPNYRATIGVDFALKVLNWDQETVRLQLWDIAGRGPSSTGLLQSRSV